MATEIDLGIDHLADVSTIGRGGFSVVYAASHTLFKRRMAVKLLNPLTKESERLRFERECEVMGRLSDHPNVVSVFNAGYTDNDRPYLLMELVEGGTLQDRLEQGGPLPWREAVGHLLPICGALAAAHRESILHRDVKPENILLTIDGEPRLADFGIASLRDATGATSTHITASMLHTAPETFENLRDERSDLYSLASTLYALVVGRAPFWHDSDQSIHPLMNRLLNDPAPAMPAEMAPPELSLLIQRALAKDPNHRPQTADDLARELGNLLGDAGDSTPPPGETQQAIEPPPGPYQFGRPNTDDFASGPAPGRPSTGDFAPGPAPGRPTTGDYAPQGFTGAPVPPQPWSPDPVAPAEAVDDVGHGPGWYHASGDPPGTQRFWTGNEWQGSPQPVSMPAGAGLNQSPGPYPGAAPHPGTSHFAGTGAYAPGRPNTVAGPELASPERRILARIIDLLLWVGAWMLLLVTVIPTEDDSPATYLQILALGLFTTMAIAAYEIIMVAAFGATLGKLLVGTRVIKEDGSPADFSTAAMRMVMFIIISVISAAIWFPVVVMLILAGVAIGSLYSNERRQTMWDRHAKSLVVAR